MKQKSIFIAIVFFFTLILNGYSQSSLAKYVPADATFVVVINPNNLDSKVKLEELGKLPIFQLLKAQLSVMGGPAMQGFMQDMLDKPEEYGFNYMKSPLYIFANIGEEGNRVNLAIPLSNKEKFKGFIANFLPDESAIKKQGTFEMVSPEQDMAFSWNNEMALFTGIEMNWDEEKYPGETGDQHKEREAKVTMDRINQVMNSTGANSITRNAKYVSSAGKASDLSFWVDYKQIQEFQNKAMGDFGGGMEQMMYAQMLMQGMSFMYEDTYMAGNLNFNDGAIDMDTKFFGNQKLLDLVSSMLDTKINKKFAKYVKSDNLLGYWAMGYNVENSVKGMEDMLMPMVRNIPMAGNIAEPALDVLNIVLDEDALYNLIKGDMVLAVTGISEFKTTGIEYDEDFNAKEVEKVETLPEFSLMLSTGGEENIRKLLKLGESSTMLTGKGGYHLVSVPDADLPMDIFLAVKDGILFVTNNTDLVENRLATGYTSGLPKKHAKLLKKNSQVMYMDIPKIIDAVSTLSPEMEDPMAQTMMNGVKEVFSNVMIKSHKKIDDAVVTSMSLNFVNEDRNSMEQLLNYVNALVMSMMGGGSNM